MDFTILRSVSPPSVSGTWGLTAQELDEIFDVPNTPPELLGIWFQLMFPDRWDSLTRSEQASIVARLFEIQEERAAATNLNVSVTIE